MTEIKNIRLSVILSVKDIDTLRKVCRGKTKEHLKAQSRSRHDHHKQLHKDQENYYRSLVNKFSLVLRENIGEEDFKILELGDR